MNLSLERYKLNPGKEMDSWGMERVWGKLTFQISFCMHNFLKIHIFKQMKGENTKRKKTHVKIHQALH